MIRRAFVRLAVAAALSLPFAACGGDGGTGPGGSVVGTWDLETVNGQPLPFVAVQQGADRLEVTSDRLTFSEGSSLTRTTGYRSVQSGQTTTGTESDTGTYTVDGTAVEMTFDVGDFTITASRSGSRLTVAEDGLSFVYAKQ